MLTKATAQKLSLGLESSPHIYSYPNDLNMML